MRLLCLFRRFQRLRTAEAWDDFVDISYERVVSICEKSVWPALSDAEDVAAEAVWMAYTKIFAWSSTISFEHEPQLEAWIMKISRTTTIDESRRSASRSRREASAIADWDSLRPASTPHDLDDERLGEAVSTLLDPLEALVLRLRILDRMTFDEIANSLDLRNRPAAHRLFSRAVDTLRDLLGEDRRR